MSRKLNKHAFVRKCLLTEAEQKRMKTMSLGLPTASGPVGSNDVGYNAWTYQNYNPMSKAAIDAGSVLDNADYEDNSDDEEKLDTWETKIQQHKQNIINDIDEAIKNKAIITDHTTQDSLLKFIISVVDHELGQALSYGELRDSYDTEITEDEYRDLFKDMVEDAYNSLVHKVGDIHSDILPNPFMFTPDAEPAYDNLDKTIDDLLRDLS